MRQCDWTVRQDKELQWSPSDCVDDLLYGICSVGYLVVVYVPEGLWGLMKQAGKSVT